MLTKRAVGTAPPYAKPFFHVIDAMQELGGAQSFLGPFDGHTRPLARGCISLKDYLTELSQKRQFRMQFITYHHWRNLKVGCARLENLIERGAGRSLGP